MLSSLKYADAKREEGFTLIELLVVVIIIGILAAIAIPVFLNQRQRGYQAALTSDVRNAAIDVETAVTANNGGVLAVAAGQDAVDGARQSAPDITTITYSTISDGTTLAGFCLVGTRTDLGTTAAETVTYNSTAGGVMPYGAGNCTFGG